MFVKKNRGKRLYRKRGARKSTSTVSKTVKKYVKQVVHSQIENKNICIERAQTFGSILGDNTLGAFPMCPYTSLVPVPLGTTNGTRVGNTIKPERLCCVMF